VLRKNQEIFRIAAHDSIRLFLENRNESVMTQDWPLSDLITPRIRVHTKRTLGQPTTLKHNRLSTDEESTTDNSFLVRTTARPIIKLPAN
jgi:hypothetical protein